MGNEKFSTVEKTLFASFGFCWEEPISAIGH
jgi:hypothetical protein